jgi:hypothetical protein
LHDLLDSLPQDNTSTTQLSFAEVVASGFKVVILDLPVFEGELPGGTLACEIMAIGMFASSSIRTSVGHLVIEVSVVAGHAAPPGGSGRTEVMGRLAVSGEVIEPQAIRAATVFLELILRQGIVLRIFTILGDGTSCSSSQVQGPVFGVGAFLPVLGSVSPCQFSSFAILIHQL